MNQSRTDNVSRNISYSLVCQTLVLVLSFICRTVFVKKLGAEYLGISGLFTNVLTVLSFAELGIGDAIIFSLYKPIATGETDKIKSLMRFYKNAYRVIGLIILTAGLTTLPFLDKIMAQKPDVDESISFIYFLFISNIVISYFYVYKQTLITAHQKNYIVTAKRTICIIFMYIAQIVVLIITSNYILYLVVQILNTIITNLVLARRADKEFPYLKEKNVEELEKGETSQIFVNVKALIFYKFGSVILNGTDNILISMLIGLRDVGITSNYLLVVNAFEKILQKIKSGFVASVGNLNSLENKEKQETVFNKIFMIFASLYGFASLEILCVGNDFVNLWIGKDYAVSQLTLFALVLNFYVIGVHSVSFMYRTTLGLFKQGQYSPVIATVMNIILSVILSKFWGLAGILLATPIARMLGMGIVDPILIYKKAFKKNPLNYYYMYIKYIGIFVIIYSIAKAILSMFSTVSWVTFFIKAFVVAVLYLLIMLLFFRKNRMFKEICSSALSYVKRRMHL